MLDSVTLLVVATGAVLAIVGYVLDDLGRVREATIGAFVDREMTHAYLDPMPAALRDAGTATERPAPPFTPERLGRYHYRELPEPTPESTDIPSWLSRALDRAGAAHTLDHDDSLVVFLRVGHNAQLLDCPITWSCRPLPDAQGVLIRLSFAHARGTYDRTFALRFASGQDLWHAACLARQDVLRIDFLTRHRQRGWWHGGCRLVPVPPGVTAQLRRVLLQYGQEGDYA